MKPQNLHAHEDRLLDFAYGELPAHEALAVESHLQGCTRCTEALEGIRGVRSTMAHLSLEPAPDAGLESLMAYAQQAARNAAAGPAPKPTWWRRWLVPAMGITAVSVFGLVTVQVSKTVKLQPNLTEAAAVSKNEDVLAFPSPEPQAPTAPPPPAPATAAPVARATPPPPSPPVRLDDSVREKSKDLEADWSNVGAGKVLARDEAEQKVADKKASRKEYNYDRRDAMTQSGAFSKPKPMLVGSAQGGGPTTPVASAPPPAPAAEEPMPAAAQPSMEGAAMDDAVMAEAEVQEQAPYRGGLSLNKKAKGKTAAPAKTASTRDLDGTEESFDEVFGERARSSEARREKPADMPAPAQAPAPVSAGAAPSGRIVAQTQPSRAELSQQATAALRSGNRVREAELLRQALASGAVGEERLKLLNQLCDAEFAIGRRQAAFEACNQVLEEGPRSVIANEARSRLRQEAPAAMPSSGSREPAKADQMKAPAAATPAEAP
ncbi:anti-sigma factor family protein [Hyalangium rubrum]|uniref:Putative zinc-finger domain-containing protein n=1 Tax=Hyalangium rubrum TaxID=3103134 RepID=A0ABU5H7J3_9BACT|nr:zf-HC2 domain-containing protein [Hyalangium sp. s54d21]MDY7229430.1 hypothetical protein [Hyalangium sp. s54d21]